MYPLIRLAKEYVLHRKAGELAPMATHVSHHRCWPQDIDLFMEMNNGRILTILDLGRTTLAHRVGLLRALRQNRWGLTMAGVSVRYRRRIRAFEKIEMRSRAVCWDDKFVYLEQSMWKTNGECANHALYRSAITGKRGIVPPTEALAQMGEGIQPPDMPKWVAAWIAADTLRPWPPMQE